MEKRIKKFRIVLAILTSLLVGYYFGVTKVSFEWKNYTPHIAAVNKEPPAGITTVDFAKFWTVWEKIQTTYYDKTKLDGQKMLNGAISGMIQSLNDPYTLYLPPQQNNDFKDGLAGQFQGIGAELGMDNKQIIVVAPLSGSPAGKAGIRAGDAILEVDGKSTAGWDINQAVSTIRGEKGTEVVLTVLHKGETSPQKVTIVRDVITVKSVEGWVKQIKNVDNIGQTDILKNHQSDSVAYIRLSQFGDETNKDWVTLVNKLIVDMEKEGNFKGIVLDLRNNPGGYLTDATFIAGEFLNEGTTVVIQDNGNEKQALRASRKGMFINVPLVVLINKGSASASEIVSGAMQDFSRAKLIGETSFGKGTIQQAEDLGDGAGLHVTIAKWLTPRERWIHETGLTPDVSVALNAEEPTLDTQLEKALEELVK
ncbi:MAG: S41 family peptidase [Candidatus Levyibacteriota bacterium]